jgi:hypothetical protein
MRTKFILSVVGLFLFYGGLAQATIIKDFNDHEIGTIQTNDYYDEVYVRESAVVTMSGGTISSVIRTYDTSVLNISGGSLPLIITLQNDSMLNLSGGVFNNTVMGSSDQSEIHLYGYDFVFTEYSPDTIRAEGCWANHTSFEFILFRTDYPSSHVVLHVIPEPCILSLMGIGFFLMRRAIKIPHK